MTASELYTAAMSYAKHLCIPLSNTQQPEQGGRAGVRTAASELRGVEALPPGADSWRWVPDLVLPRTALGAAALDGCLYAIGGQVRPPAACFRMCSRGLRAGAGCPPDLALPRTSLGAAATQWLPVRRWRPCASPVVRFLGFLRGKVLNWAAPPRAAVHRDGAARAQRLPDCGRWPGASRVAGLIACALVSFAAFVDCSSTEPAVRFGPRFLKPLPAVEWHTLEYLQLAVESWRRL